MGPFDLDVLTILKIISVAFPLTGNNWKWLINHFRIFLEAMHKGYEQIYND